MQIGIATLDLLSQGRAEMIVGRGSSIEAFPLFGLRLEDYDSLFAIGTRVAPVLRQGLVAVANLLQRG